MLDEAMQRIQEVKRTRQTELDLSGMELTELPEEVCELTWLTNLHLTSNWLTTLPESIGDLTALTDLILYDNRLTALPDSIGRLGALTRLDLGNNRLTVLTDTVGDLKTLTKLELGGNELLMLPESFCGLTALSILDLSDNDLETLPERFCELAELTELNLSNNELTALPELIGNLARLSNLDLYDNRLTALPASIGDLTSLTKLDLYGNRLTELPDAIGALRNLTILKCSSNNLRTLPDAVCDLVELTELGLEGNALRALPESIGNLTGLTELQLHSNKLTALPDSIGDLTGLRRIGAMHNRLTALPDAIGNLTALRELSLVGNRLESLPERIGDLTGLMELSLRGNDLWSLPESIGNLVSLAELDLWDCRIEVLPDAIGNLTALTELNLAFNRLSALPDSIGNLTNLNRLDLCYNRLSALPDSIGNLTALVSSDLSSNRLSALPDSIGNLTALETLDLESNELWTLPGSIGGLTALTKLELQDNRLSSLPAGLASIPELEELPVTGNPFAPEVAAASESGHAGLMTFLREIATDGVDVREAKLVVVGEGAVGKSTLLAAMMGEPFDADRSSTHGIEVKPLVLAEGTSEACVLNAWDFGGQPTYRPTHQLFFTAPAVYLVVWKPRHGPRQDNVEEWIELIRRRAGDDVRVHVVATHGGPKDRFAHIDETALRQAHGQVIAGFHHIDSRTGEGIEELKAAVLGTASGLPHFTRKLPGSWRRFQESQRRAPEPYLEYREYLARAAEYGLTETSARTLATVATDLGHWCHYPNIPGLDQLVVLKGDWLSAAVSLVIDDAQTVRDHGLIEHSSLKEIWDDPSNPPHLRYPEKVHRVLLRLMEEYEISYRVSGGHGGRPPTSLIAQLVDPSTPPLGEWEDYGRGLPVQSRILKFSDASGNFHLPEGLIYRLIVRLHQFSLGRERYEQSLHWTGGLVIDHGFHGRALIKLGRSQLTVTVKAVVPEYLLTMIVEEVRAHVGDFWQGVKVHTLVSCGGSCSDPEASRRGQWELERLFNRRIKGKPEITCGSCDEDVSIQELLNSVDTPSTPDGRLVQAVESALDPSFNQQVTSILSNLDFSKRTHDAMRVITRAESYLQDILRALEDEAAFGPRLFTIEFLGANQPASVHDADLLCRVTFWCEYARKPVWEISGEPMVGVYELNLSVTWLSRAASWVNAMAALLEVALPVGVGDVTPVHELRDAIATQRGRVESSYIDNSWPARSFTSTAELAHTGALLRELHAVLADRTQLTGRPSIGGLVRVRSRGRYLWVHPRFEAELNPGLPEMGSGSISGR